MICNNVVLIPLQILNKQTLPQHSPSVAAQSDADRSRFGDQTGAGHSSEKRQAAGNSCSAAAATAGEQVRFFLGCMSLMNFYVTVG